MPKAPSSNSSANTAAADAKVTVAKSLAPVKLSTQFGSMEIPSLSLAKNPFSLKNGSIGKPPLNPTKRSALIIVKNALNAPIRLALEGLLPSSTMALLPTVPLPPTNNNNSCNNNNTNNNSCNNSSSCNNNKEWFSNNSNNCTSKRNKRLKHSYLDHLPVLLLLVLALEEAHLQTTLLTTPLLVDPPLDINSPLPSRTQRHLTNQLEVVVVEDKDPLKDEILLRPLALLGLPLLDPLLK